MKKKTLLLCLIIALCFSIGGVISASAAVQEREVSSQTLTDAGNLNIIDWDTTGNSDVFVPTVTNYYASYGSLATAYLYYGEKLDLTKGNVVITYDLLGGDAMSWFGAWLGADTTTTLNDMQFYVNSIQAVSAAPYRSDWTAYTTEDMTESYPSHFQVGYTYKAADDVAIRVVQTFKAENQVYGLQTYGIKADGSLALYNSIWFKNKFPEELSTSAVFGFYFGNSNASVDNVEFKQGETVLLREDFSTKDNIIAKSSVDLTGSSTAGKLALEGSRFGESYLRINNPTSADRLVSASEVDGKDVEKAFDMTGKIRFNTLANQFGLATGLENMDSEIDSFVYFYEKDGTTRIASTKTGDEVDLGVSLVGKQEFTDFSVSATSDGTITVSILDKTATFTGFTVVGKFAFVVQGEGDTQVDLEKTLTTTTYFYRESEKESDANNFNTGYVNPEDWNIQSTTAQFMTDPADARGVVVEDGKLYFYGSGDYSYFATTSQYADYVLEFDFISEAKETRPETSYTSYGGLCVGVGSKSYSGWINSAMILFHEGFVQLQNWQSGACTQVEAGIEYNINANETEDKITAIKFVVYNGNIKVYAQDITNTEFDVANYVEVLSVKVPSTYGYISFCSSESAYFAIDNVRITSISDPSETVMEEAIANYQDKATIADEAEPVILVAPVVTLTENVVTWEAVENATGYKVYVNDVAGDVISDLTYTINAEAGQSYEVKVVAVGNGDNVIDSVASNAVVYTAPGASESENKNSSSAGGCMGGIGSSSVLALAMLGVVTIIKKRNR